MLRGRGPSSGREARRLRQHVSRANGGYDDAELVQASIALGSLPCWASPTPLWRRENSSCDLARRERPVGTQDLAVSRDVSVTRERRQPCKHRRARPVLPVCSRRLPRRLSAPRTGRWRRVCQTRRRLLSAPSYRLLLPNWSIAAPAGRALKIRSKCAVLFSAQADRLASTAAGLSSATERSTGGPSRSPSSGYTERIGSLRPTVLRFRVLLGTDSDDEVFQAE
jgi:hypothetical protein